MSVAIVIVYHSGFGHTKVLAEAVEKGATGENVHVQLLSVEEVENHWDDLDRADAIVFGSPTYMGSVSGPFKQFMDSTSTRWMEGRWQDKLAAGFTNSASQSGDKLNTLVQMAVFAAQHGMVWISLGLKPGNNSSQGSPEDLNRIGSSLGVMAQSNADQGPELVPPESDRKTGEYLGRRVAELAQRWSRD